MEFNEWLNEVNVMEPDTYVYTNVRTGTARVHVAPGAAQVSTQAQLTLMWSDTRLVERGETAELTS